MHLYILHLIGDYSANELFPKRFTQSFGGG